MNLLISCIGKRGGFIAELFRRHLGPSDRILGTANTQWTPGFRACDKAFVLPSVEDTDYVPALLQLCERERVDAILCMEDFDLEKLARVRAEFLDRGVIPLMPPVEVVEMAADKLKTADVLSAAGVATPRTAKSPDEAAAFRYPMYVKPRRGSGSRQVFRARSPAELAVFFDYAPDMIIQEEVVGAELNLQLCADFEGHLVGLCALRKCSMRHGETDQAETFWDPEVLRFARSLGEIVGGFGAMDIDVIQRGEHLFVLEINPRFGGGYPAAHLAGVDFPKLLLELLREGAVRRPMLSYAPGVVMLKDSRVLGGPAERFFADELHVASPRAATTSGAPEDA